MKEIPAFLKDKGCDELWYFNVIGMLLDDGFIVLDDAKKALLLDMVADLAEGRYKFRMFALEDKLASQGLSVEPPLEQEIENLQHT